MFCNVLQVHSRETGDLVTSHACSFMYGESNYDQSCEHFICNLQCVTFLLVASDTVAATVLLFISVQSHALTYCQWISNIVGHAQSCT